MWEEEGETLVLKLDLRRTGIVVGEAARGGVGGVHAGDLVIELSLQDREDLRAFINRVTGHHSRAAAVGKAGGVITLLKVTLRPSLSFFLAPGPFFPAFSSAWPTSSIFF